MTTTLVLPVVPVLVAAAAAFVLGGAWYAVLGSPAGAVDDPPPRSGGGTALVEVVRCLVLAAVVVGLTSATSTSTWAGGLLLGLALWTGFPLVLWCGAIWHERTPWRTAAVHAGDWLVKLVATGVLAGVLL